MYSFDGRMIDDMLISVLFYGALNNSDRIMANDKIDN